MNNSFYNKYKVLIVSLSSIILVLIIIFIIYLLSKLSSNINPLVTTISNISIKDVQLQAFQ